ncbi:MAG: Ni/Fe-hydrogenase, b-type cytochrome subunit [Gemmatimonadetes bacterium]|nr:Ni/Fe-hydrogenase, b-type cytochrome subunit [Gemmatimonadota bacterium]
MTPHAKSAEDSFRAGAPVQYRRIYLWHWAVRAMHWVSVLCILTLIVTGTYIAHPYFTTSGEASAHYLMGDVRFVHFTAAGLLVATAMLRVYWLFIGNRFERWSALLPYGKEDWKNMWLVIKRYLFIQPWRAPHYLGHNPLEQATDSFMYLVAIVQILTGFYMFGLATPGGFFFTTFGWVGALFGGAQSVRFWHHLLMWPWMVFIPVHVYMTVRADVVHQESRISSMVGGGRYARADVEFIDD